MSGLALRLPHLLLLAVLLSARGARAAPPDSSDAAGDRPVFFDTATVEARPVDSATATVTVLLPAEVEASGARSLADLLREVPALSVLGSGGRAGVTYVSVRGGDPNFTLVLLDGIPLNDWTERQGGAVNLEELPAGLVDRVEVVQGPLTSFYGPSGLAGVVQLFTRGGSGETKVGLRAEAGDASHLRGAAALSGSADALRYSSGVSWEQEQDRIADERYRQVDAWGGLDRRFANDTDFRLRGRFVSGETSDYPDASGGPVYGDGLLRSSDHRDLSLGAELDFGPATSRRQQLALSFYGRDLDRESPAVLPVVPASTESTAFSRFRAAWQAPLRRGARTTIDLGASALFERADNESALVLAEPPGLEVPGNYRERRTSGGLYTELRHVRGAFLFEGALRVDAVPGGRIELNPRVGVLWKPTDRTRVRTSFGRASKLPSFFALASPPALGGNPDLRPETALGGELGADHSAGRVQLSGSVFRHQYRDLVDFDFEQFTHVNRAHVRAQGASLRLKWLPAKAWELEGEATFTDAEDAEGAPLLQRARWIGGARITFRPRPGSGLRLDARFTSSYLDRQIPVPDRDSVGGYVVLGTTAWWRLSHDWTARARIDNLAGRAYETFIGFPGAGRSFWLGLGWRELAAP